MHTFLTFLVAAAMLATLGVLVAGMIGMARGSAGGTAQRLMRYRILFQFLALLLFAVLMLLVR